MEPYDQIIETVMADLQSEFGDDLLGVLLVGSLAYGVPRPHSDIDLFALIRPAWRQRRTFFVDEVEVEIFFNPVQQVRAEFRDTDNPATIAMFAQGRILFDPTGLMKQLVHEAQSTWQRPRPAVAPGTYRHFSLRYTCVDLLKDAQDLLEVDEDAAEWVMFAALQSALNAYYHIQRRWPVKPKYQLSDLEQHAPDLALLVRRMLSGKSSIQERYMALESLIDQVLEPIGGRLGEWRSAPESVAESAPATIHDQRMN
jgi:hypothetical protein